MAGDQRRQLVLPVGIQLDRRPRYGGVGCRPLLAELAAVRDLAGQWMAEGEDAFGVELDFVEEAVVGQIADQRVRLVAAQAGGETERPLRDLLAGNRGRLQEPLCLWT